MQITLDPRPSWLLPYSNAGRRGGVEVAHLPLWFGVADQLPGSLDAVVFASDLQGYARVYDGSSALLGVALAEWLDGLADDGELPPLDRCGVVLAGDLYAVPDRRGGYGDVGPVWRAFGDRFAWVVGVAGNHDDVSSLAGRRPAHLHLLDGDVVELDGWTVGGVGRVPGDPSRPGRRHPSEQRELVERVVAREPDLLVMHDVPPGLDGVPVVVGGHVARPEPWEGGVLNVHERVVVLRR